MAAPKPFVPTLELTAGQPTPIAANHGLSYMSFDRQGDAGTHEAGGVQALLDHRDGLALGLRRHGAQYAVLERAR